MRIVLFSDIHGNSTALDAVLADIRRLGSVDAYWVVGDLVGIGPDPVGVLDRLYRLENAFFMRGNTDRYVITGKRPRPTRRAIKSHPDMLAQLVAIAESFAWTQGAITASGWFEWLSKHPLEKRLTLPDGTRLLGVHASPGHDSGQGIHPGLSTGQIRSLLNGCQADLVCVGHTHWPMDFNIDRMRVINLGSVSNPYPPDLRASYALIDVDRNGYRIEMRRVDYNRDAVIAAVQRVRHPAANYIIQVMRGQLEPSWQKNLK